MVGSGPRVQKLTGIPSHIEKIKYGTKLMAPDFCGDHVSIYQHTAVSHVRWGFGLVSIRVMVGSGRRVQKLTGLTRASPVIFL